MKKRTIGVLAIALCAVIALAGYGALTSDGTTKGFDYEDLGYTRIFQDEAKAMMDEGGVMILDVREQHEYDEVHIKDAVLLPVGEINEETAAQVIPEKDSVVLAFQACAISPNRRHISSGSSVVMICISFGISPTTSK